MLNAQQMLADGQTYSTKMDAILKDAVTKWWEGLSKEELCAYLLEQPTITADQLRDMLANEECLLRMEVNFAVASKDAAADFHTGVE